MTNRGTESPLGKRPSEAGVSVLSEMKITAVLSDETSPGWNSFVGLGTRRGREGYRQPLVWMSVPGCHRVGERLRKSTVESGRVVGNPRQNQIK